MSTKLSPVDLLEKLNRCLAKFGARQGHKCDDYSYYCPTREESKLGSGAQGTAFRMKSKVTGKLVVVKEIPKAYVSRSEVNVQHLAIEIAVTRMVQHPTLNHCVDLIHNTETIFMVLESCDSSKGDLSTRLYFLMAKYYPARIGLVPSIVGGFEAEVAHQILKKGCNDEESCLLRIELEEEVIKKTCSEFGLKEDPVESDLFHAIVHAHRIPEGKAAVIAKQILEGLHHLHKKRVVHRDIKTENIVLGERRRAIPICDPVDNPNNVVGVRLLETVDVRIIDFGLAKYLENESNTAEQPVRTPSPSHFALGTQWNRACSEDFEDLEATPSTIDNTTTNATTAGGGLMPPPQMSPPIAVTPCGTHSYCSLEVLDGIIGRRKHYMSTKRTLPKFDIHGAGTVLFCMLNGCPPFHLPVARGAMSTAQRMEHLRRIRELVLRGAIFKETVSDTAKEFCMKLMSNEVTERPDARVALQDSYLQGITRRYVTEVTCDGERRVVVDAQTRPFSIATTSTISRTDSDAQCSSGPGLADVSEGIDAEESEADVAAALRRGEAALNEVLRFDEDDGDCRGKEDAEEEE